MGRIWTRVKHLKIWTRVKRLFRCMVENPREDNQVLVDRDASPSLSRLPDTGSFNQGTKVCVPTATSEPSSSNHQIISKSIQFDNSADSQPMVDMDASASPRPISSNDQIISQLDSHPSSSSTLPSSSTAGRTLVDRDASPSLSRLPDTGSFNQETKVCVPTATSEPSSSNHQIISKSIQFDNSADSQPMVDMDASASPRPISSNDQIISQHDRHPSSSSSNNDHIFPTSSSPLPPASRISISSDDLTASSPRSISSNDQIISQHDRHPSSSSSNDDHIFPIFPSSSSTLPSSSTAGRTRWKYDVFLSFRGPDTRKGITSEIRDRLQSRGIRTFMDETDLGPGETISPTLIKAIEESRFAVVVFSPNYASSPWCLEELAKIWKCMANQDRIFPIFFKVEPAEVRHQHMGSFKEAFNKHETSGRHKPEIVKQWRTALKGVADISGWSTDEFKTHRDLIDKIVESLHSKLPPDAIESDFQAYKATTKAMKEVKEALRDDGITAVGVYGMGGVGKTTMVRHVAAKACRKGTFNQWIEARVSQDPKFKQIQGTLADLLGVNLGEETETGRARRLHKEIMRREKLLIILDDVWDFIELSEIGIPSSNELQTVDSKVLLTTRRIHVCYVMECQRPIPLNILSEADSWALFEKKARRCFESPTFEGVAKKVAEECGGLPIALITVARALGGKDLVEWERAAERLKKSQTANPDDDGKAFKCIKLSYDYLKDEEYKSYFLLCCLFPEDDEINLEDLFKYALGQGLFRDTDTLKEARERAESLARHLQHSCLLLEDGNNERYVRMHDVVRDAAIQIARSEHGFLVKAGCGLEDWPHQPDGDYSAISLMRNHICQLPENLVCPKLQILLLNENSYLKEIPETFFQSPNELRVFDLSDTSISKLPENLVCPKLQILLLNDSELEEIPETFFRSPNELRVFDLSRTSISFLPQSFSRLTNLQALYLDDLDHDWEDWEEFPRSIDTSMLGKLKKLEILSMREVSLKELSIELGGLTNLRIFDNRDGSCIERIPRNVISKWHNLEELYIEGFGGWGSKVEGEGEETNAGFDEVTSLSKLRVLKATIPDVECIPKYVRVLPKWFNKFDICIIGGLEIEDIDILGGLEIEGSSLPISDRLPEWFVNEIQKKKKIRMNWGSGLMGKARERLVKCVKVSHGRIISLKWSERWEKDGRWEKGWESV